MPPTSVRPGLLMQLRRVLAQVHAMPRGNSQRRRSYVHTVPTRRGAEPRLRWWAWKDSMSDVSYEVRSALTAPSEKAASSSAPSIFFAKFWCYAALLKAALCLDRCSLLLFSWDSHLCTFECGHTDGLRQIFTNLFQILQYPLCSTCAQLRQQTDLTPKTKHSDC